MPTKLEVVKGKVEQYLGELYGTYEKGPNFYRIRHQSTAVIISVFDWINNLVLVQVQALVLRDVEETGALYIAMGDINKQYFFGKLNYFSQDKSLVFEHFLLGDYLDKEELNSAVLSLAFIADKIDDELKEKFGGKRFVDQ